MTPTPGKRKRRDLVDQGLNLAPSQEYVDSKHVQVLFKQHFESKFEPLPIAHTKFIQATDTGEAEVTDESISDWGGISDDEDRAEIVQHTISKSCKADVPTEEVKSFMVSNTRTFTSHGELILFYCRRQSHRLQAQLLKLKGSGYPRWAQRMLKQTLRISRKILLCNTY